MHNLGQFAVRENITVSLDLVYCCSVKNFCSTVQANYPRLAQDFLPSVEHMGVTLSNTLTFV